MSMSSTASTQSNQTMVPLDGTVEPARRDRSMDFHRPRLPKTRVLEYPAPRLISLEERRRIVRGTDPDLRAFAGSEASLPQCPDAYLTYDARVRRRAWFAFMLIISIFPFMSILVFKGKFDSALSWYTKGEVDTLSDAQKRIIRVLMIVQFIIWPFLLFFLIWRCLVPTSGR